MNVIAAIQSDFIQYLMKHFSTQSEVAENCKLILNADPQRQHFGDLSTSAPLLLAKTLKKNPSTIAENIISSFKHTSVKRIELAGAGFLNLYLTEHTFRLLAQELIEQKTDFFKPCSIEKRRIPIEFVSANPTGPLHFGHGRGGIIGDVLGNIFTFLGHTVVKEFYINDAGNQIEKLALSLFIRCQQAIGISVQMAEDGYHGAYLEDLAQQCLNEYGNTVLQNSTDFFKTYAQNHLLNNIKQTLTKYGIIFDVYFSEKTLHEQQAIEAVVEQLLRAQLVYQKDDALWLASSQFGDDKDRVIRKSTGEWTYVAADIAYLKNKVERGFDHLFMVLGHDHHSYEIRLQAVRSALKIQTPLDIILYQLVKIKEGESEVRMSKRAGTMVVLEEIIDTVGKDVARFFYLHRKADAQLEFDIALALKKTEENPVYYIQYAYVRIQSILARATALFPSGFSTVDTEHITENEQLLLKKVITLKDLLETIAQNYQTHLLTYYLIELATLFHNYYAHTKIIDEQDPERTKARLILLTIIRNTLGVGLDLLGIEKPERM